MGLISGLLLLPLAPVRGTVWIAEQIAAEADRARDGETRIRRELAAIELEHEAGALSVEEFEAREDALLEELERLHDERRGGA